MRIQSFTTVAASLMLVLVFVFVANLISSNQVNAQPRLAVLQDEDGSFDPIQENSQNEGAEKWDEEGEPSEDHDHDEDELNEHEDDEDEEDHEELEHEFMFLELEKLSIENNMVRLEFMNRMTEIAKDKEATAAYAIMHLEEFLEEDEVIGMLEKHLESNVSDATRNLIRMKLAEAYMHADRPEDSLGILNLLISGSADLDD